MTPPGSAPASYIATEKHYYIRVNISSKYYFSDIIMTIKSHFNQAHTLVPMLHLSSYIATAITYMVSADVAYIKFINV